MAVTLIVVVNVISCLCHAPANSHVIDADVSDLPFLVNELQWMCAFWYIWLWLWWTDADSSTSLIRVTLTRKSL